MPDKVVIELNEEDRKLLEGVIEALDRIADLLAMLADLLTREKVG